MSGSAESRLTPMQKRVVWAAVMITIVVIALAAGGFVFCTAVALISCATVFEISIVFHKKEVRPWLIPPYVFCALYSYLYLLWGIRPVIALYLLALFAVIIRALVTQNVDAVEVFAAFAIFVYPILLVSCAALLYLCFQRPYGITALTLCIGCANCADAAALFGGMRFGKRKLCPKISPKKTVAGSLFAFLGGIVFGYLTCFLQQLWGAHVPLLSLLIIGFLAGATSQIGDLFASMIKRWGGIKDFTKLIPEHGGVMDRIDSTIATAPMVLGVFVLLQYMGLIPW